MSSLILPITIARAAIGTLINVPRIITKAPAIVLALIAFLVRLAIILRFPQQFYHSPDAPSDYYHNCHAYPYYCRYRHHHHDHDSIDGLFNLLHVSVPRINNLSLANCALSCAQAL